MKIQEVVQDLFAVPAKYSLVHCVSSDCAMAAGIAKEFRQRLPDMPAVVRTRHEGIGTCCLYARTTNGQIDLRVFNLITKNMFWHKPSYVTLNNSLIDLREQCITMGIKHLAMPRIGCGLDRLDWTAVKQLLCEVFEYTDIEILVCRLED